MRIYNFFKIYFTSNKRCINESESDRKERCIILRLFNSNIEKVEKIMLKEIIINIGNISDRVQTVADRLSIAIIKRRI